MTHPNSLSVADLKAIMNVYYTHAVYHTHVPIPSVALLKCPFLGNRSNNIFIALYCCVTLLQTEQHLDVTYYKHLSQGNIGPKIFTDKESKGKVVPVFKYRAMKTFIT